MPAQEPFVNFFIAGVQKGGTTALDRFLRDCPTVRMARAKEPHFFDDESLDWSEPPISRYHAMYDLGHDDRLVGDATPILSYWPNALQRVAKYNPNARIVLCLRHPTFRAYSHWRMETRRGAESLSFHDAIGEAGRRRVHAAPGGVHRVFSYVERGFYAPQVERVQKLFPGRVMFLRTDVLWRFPEATLASVLSFLGAPAHTPAHVAKDVSVTERIEGADRRYLDDLFAEDIRRTAQLTELDLGDWLDPRYAEAMGSIV